MMRNVSTVSKVHYFRGACAAVNSKLDHDEGELKLEESDADTNDGGLHISTSI